MAHWTAQNSGGNNSPGSGSSNGGVFKRVVGDGPWPVGGFNFYAYVMSDGSHNGLDWIRLNVSNTETPAADFTISTDVADYTLWFDIYPANKYMDDYVGSETRYIIYDSFYDSPYNYKYYMSDLGYDYNSIQICDPEGNIVSKPDFKNAGGYIALSVNIKSKIGALNMYSNINSSNIINSERCFKELSNILHNLLPPIKDARTGKMVYYDLEMSDYYYAKIGFNTTQNGVAQIRRPQWITTQHKQSDVKNTIPFDLYKGRRSWVNNMSYINTIEMCPSLSKLAIIPTAWSHLGLLDEWLPTDLFGWWGRKPQTLASWPYYWMLDGGYDNGESVLQLFGSGSAIAGNQYYGGEWTGKYWLKNPPPYWPYAGYESNSFTTSTNNLHTQLFAPISRGVLETLFKNKKIYVKTIGATIAKYDLPAFYPEFGANMGNGVFVKYE